MKKRILSLALCLVMLAGLLPHLSPVASAADTTPLTATEAVADMTWGVNLADLYMADSEDLQNHRTNKDSTGYIEYTPVKTYDLAIGLWFWDETFE